MELNEKSGLTRRTFLAGSAFTAAAAGLALSGCGPSNSGSASSSSAAPEPESSSEAPVREITAAFAYAGNNVNPIGNSSALMLAAGWHVFDGLYNLDLRTYETYAGLAAGEPVKVSDLQYEVALRDNARYSNGNEVSVDDVVNAFERNMADATYGALLSFIESVAAKDESTVSFTLRYPFESLLKNRLSIVKVFPASMTDSELNTLPIGSGPWAYDEIDGDDGGEVTFVPNGNYEGDYPAAADSMRWSVMLDDARRAAALSDGTVDVIESAPESSVDQLLSAGATVDYEQGFSQALLVFNCQKEPFNDPRVRQAFFYAIDAERLIDDTLNGHGEPVSGFLPRSHPNYHEASTVYEYDPGMARDLLEQAGVDTLDITLVVNNNWVKDLATSVKGDLDAVGINTTIAQQKIDWPAYAPREDGSVNEDFDVLLTPGDPSCFGNDPDLLMSWWYGDNVWTQGRSYWAKAGDGRFEQLQDLMRQARETSGAAQQAIWDECFDLIAENVPIYALFHREIATGYRAERLSGFEPIATTGLLFLGVSPTD